jgi:hypothetical protein
MTGESIQLVTQRISSCRLMVSEQEDRWITTGPGLVIYLSFIASEDQLNLQDRFERIIKGIMTAKLATISGWNKDHSDAESIQGLLTSESASMINLVVIPQATLAGKLKEGDKYLKYHRQLTRERGFELYSNFLSTLSKFFNASCPPIDMATNSNEPIPGRLGISWGTYGGRQGFEMVSTGPSTHFFQY